MNKIYPVTGHCIVKNEDRFIWYAINSVLPYLEKLIIYDTGSTDKTVEIIKSINTDKIIFRQKKQETPEELVALRLEQIKETSSPWFFLLDGDEIWPEKSITGLLENTIKASKDKLAVVCRTRNCVGDIYHFLPENAGRYELLGLKGHLNIRLLRNLPGISITGVYPLEAYTYLGKPVNLLEDKMVFEDVWYLHTTHLARSTNQAAENIVFGRKDKFKYELGLKIQKSELPEVLFLTVPFPSSILEKRKKSYFLKAMFLTPLKTIKRILIK